MKKRFFPYVIPAEAGMTSGLDSRLRGNDKVGRGNDMECTEMTGGLDSRLRGNDKVGRGNDVMNS